jgi:hypothetical protein
VDTAPPSVLNTGMGTVAEFSSQITNLICTLEISVLSLKKGGQMSFSPLGLSTDSHGTSELISSM